METRDFPMFPIASLLSEEALYDQIGEELHTQKAEPYARLILPVRPDSLLRSSIDHWKPGFHPEAKTRLDLPSLHAPNNVHCKRNG